MVITNTLREIDNDIDSTTNCWKSVYFCVTIVLMDQKIIFHVIKSDVCHIYPSIFAVLFYQRRS